MVQPDIHDKESDQEMEKDAGYESVEQIDRRFPFQEARFERDETNNQTMRDEHFTGPLLYTSPINSPNRIITIPCVRVQEQPLYLYNSAIWNQRFNNIYLHNNETNNATNKIDDRDQNNQLR
ncbi:MAG: hypothetical protein EZS28_015070 [Streblomastix strix]|uniref:Uncharacterized protein n=1 Tax=Streblomastix strix TaxID=222440 RepID=A0A5J4W3D4_9EUKA|nr:MAG: hypothetical protein EZS28_015070 [Streblomastix strix]